MSCEYFPRRKEHEKRQNKVMIIHKQHLCRLSQSFEWTKGDAKLWIAGGLLLENVRTILHFPSNKKLKINFAKFNLVLF